MSEISKSNQGISRKRDSERRTRVHLSLFDRVKFILLFALTYLILVWALLSNRKSTRLNSSHTDISRMPSSA